MRIALVQPSRTIEEKHDRDLRPATWERLKRLTREAARDADLVVWPETARPDPLIWRSGTPFSDHRMEILARRVGVPILYGCEIARVGEGRVEAFYNGAAIAYPDGRPGDWYERSARQRGSCTPRRAGMRPCLPQRSTPPPGWRG